MKTRLIQIAIALAVLGAPAFAAAQGATPPASGPDRGAFVLGVRAGGLFAQPFTEGRLGASFLVGVETGYVLPVLRRAFAITADVGYTQPTASGTQMDPRVQSNGGTYTWSITQQELLVGLTVMYRMTFIARGRVAPYLGIGPRVWFLRTLATGAAGGSTISESQEQSTRVGLSVPLGVDIALGPGALFVEAQLFWAPIDHRITGDSSVGSINAVLGYRLML